MAVIGIVCVTHWVWMYEWRKVNESEKQNFVSILANSSCILH